MKTTAYEIVHKVKYHLPMYKKLEKQKFFSTFIDSFISNLKKGENITDVLETTQKNIKPKIFNDAISIIVSEMRNNSRPLSEAIKIHSDIFPKNFIKALENSEVLEQQKIKYEKNKVKNVNIQRLPNESKVPFVSNDSLMKAMKNLKVSPKETSHIAIPDILKNMKNVESNLKRDNTILLSSIMVFLNSSKYDVMNQQRKIETLQIAMTSATLSGAIVYYLKGK